MRKWNISESYDCSTNTIATRSQLAVAILLVIIFLSFQFILLPASAAGKLSFTSSTKGTGPTELRILSSIEESNSFMDSLYKDKYPQEVASPDRAVIAEYQSIPLAVVTDDGTVIHAGEDVRLDFVIPSTKIENAVIKETSV